MKRRNKWRPARGRYEFRDGRKDFCPFGVVEVPDVVSSLATFLKGPQAYRVQEVVIVKKLR